MSRSSPNITAAKPTNLFLKPVRVDFKDFFKALAKGITHTAVGKWEDLANDTVDALASVGLSTQPDELAFILIYRSLARALFDLIGDTTGRTLADPKEGAAAVLDQMDLSVALDGVAVDRRFFDRPARLQVVQDVQDLLRIWLIAQLGEEHVAQSVSARFPSYFVYALNQEWRRNLKSYQPLIAAVDTPFTRAGDREWAWIAYASLLRKRIQEGVMGEAFGLDQIFVDLNAYYLLDAGDNAASEIRESRTRPRRVVPLQTELERWLANPVREDAIRILSGGPGSGKSSFARVFAARIADRGVPKCLFVPLHLIDPSKDLVDEVARFVRDEGILVQNPLDPASPEPDLLIIFDGLDELASQGKASAETARAFVREVDRTVEKRNLQRIQLRVLISGRELVVQENESEFRRPGQILNLLPYFVSSNKAHSRQDAEEYVDPEGLLKSDLREVWWKQYGALIGQNYGHLPEELRRDDLDEITAQPLLNYLIALSYRRGRLDFTKDINLNLVYADLVAAVHERGYEKRRPWAPIRHMRLEDFLRVLEEIGLAAWHGDGRTTTIREIEEHCRASGVGKLLDSFQEGAQAGVTRLLAAFFFRQYGQRASGDPTFVFTHKSFGEYLTARRIVRAIERVIKELERRASSPDEGWEPRDALKYWCQICGPSAISPYLHAFLLKEIGLRKPKDLFLWQQHLTELFNYTLAYSMPMEQLQLVRFKTALFQSRNAEEALLVALNACARITGRVSPIRQPDPTSFGTWLKRIQGQRAGADSALVLRCLSHLDLEGAILHNADLYAADLSCSVLKSAGLVYATLDSADLHGLNLEGARLVAASVERADLRNANLSGIEARSARFRQSNFTGAKLYRAGLPREILEETYGLDIDGQEVKFYDKRGELEKTSRKSSHVRRRQNIAPRADSVSESDG